MTQLCLLLKMANCLFNGSWIVRGVKYRMPNIVATTAVSKTINVLTNS